MTSNELARALEVAESVLAPRGLDAKSIAYFLAEASGEKYFPDYFDDMQRADYAQRNERIKALENVLELYRMHEPALVPAPLPKYITEIEALLKAEKSIHRGSPPPKKPNNRPVSAKNAEAATIFGLLKAQGVDAWDASGMIAEMFIRAGIEDKAHDKVRRALYDKLNRTT